MKKRVCTVVGLFLIAICAFMFAKETKAAQMENGYYKQEFYFDDLDGNRHLIVENYVKEDGTGYSIAYSKNGSKTKYDNDEAIEAAYEEWIEGTYKFHYFSALRFGETGGRYIQRVAVDLNKKAYALFYKCIDTENEDEYSVEEIAASNIFGFKRRKFAIYDKMIYMWEIQENGKGGDILAQLGPDSLDELDPNKQTTKAPETTQPIEETTTAKITVGKTVVKTAKKKKSAKKLLITLKKVSGASGYNIEISKKKNFSKVLIKKTTKKVSLTITNNKLKNVAVYVRARAYKEVAGTKKNGKWSTAKKSK